MGGLVGGGVRKASFAASRFASCEACSARFFWMPGYVVAPFPKNLAFSFDIATIWMESMLFPLTSISGFLSLNSPVKAGFRCWERVSLRCCPYCRKMLEFTRGSSRKEEGGMLVG